MVYRLCIQQWEGLIELLGSVSKATGGLEFLHKYEFCLCIFIIILVIVFPDFHTYNFWCAVGIGISNSPLSKFMMEKLRMLLGKL